MLKTEEKQLRGEDFLNRGDKRNEKRDDVKEL